METPLFAWKLLVIALLANSAYLLVILSAQRLEKQAGKLRARHDIIPGTRQIFLYWQDFTTQVAGNTFLMPFVLYVFLWQLLYQGFHSSVWLWFIGIAIVDMCLFAMMCLAKDHKPDWGYPLPGRMSVCGFLQLLYHGAFTSIIAISLYSLVMHWADIPGMIMITCLVIYLAFARLDYKFGYFEKLKKTTQ
jgi:hypothetical protein